MKTLTLIIGILLLTLSAVQAQFAPIPASLRTFLGRFVQAVSTVNQPKTGDTPALQYFMADTTRVADVNYPETVYGILYPTTSAKNWLSQLNTTFGNVLFYSVDTTKLKASIALAKQGRVLITLSVPVTIEGLRKANQTSHQISEEQIWQVVQLPKGEDNLKLGYRVMSIRSLRRPFQTAILTADRIEKLQKQLNDDLLKLAWEGSTPQQRKTILDDWKGQNLPDTLYLTQGKTTKRMLLTDWEKQRLAGDALANLLVESMDLRWAEVHTRYPDMEPIRRVTEWKNIRLSFSDTGFFSRRAVYYEKVKPTDKSVSSPTLTVERIYVNQ